MDGKTMICLDDLSDYSFSFSLHNNNETRALFVNKQGVVPSGFYPTIARGTVRDIDGYTYETDICAYVNGQEITAENIGDRLAVCVEDLWDNTTTGTVRNLGFEYPAYLMRYVYLASSRSLYQITSFLVVYRILSPLL